MATSMNPRPESEAVHQYHADAYVLSADLEQPLDKDIEPQAYVEIEEESNGHSVYKFQEAKPYRLQGVISYEGGYTQVAGHKSPKAGHGFTTLATSVVEGLNVLDVITADRVVGQISTDHPFFDNGQVPSVTFLGTRFDNLRIGGHKVELEQDLNILGPKPTNGNSYFEDDEVLRKVGKQYENINNVVGLPEWASKKYRWDRAAAQKRAEFSLINRVDGAPTALSFGHVLDVPHFGRIFLGELTMTRTPAVSKDENETYHFSLAMIRLEMGCIAQGNATVVVLDSNGTGKGKKSP